MTDNTNQSNPVTPDATSELSSSTTTWQLSALTAALGDLQLSVSDSLSVGRGSDNDVVLGSKAVSRNHAVLSVLDTELYVKDLDSSNGTFVNNKLIEANKTVQLNADDKLGFASFEFQVMALAAEDIESSAIDPATKEPEEIVGSVQEDLESTSTPSKQSATESSLPPAAVEETIAARPASPSEPVSAEATPEPVVKETIVEEVLAASAGEAAMSAAPVEEDIIAPTPAQNEPQETVTAEPVAKEQVAATPVVEDPVVKEPATKDPVVEEPIVKEPKAEAPVAERQSPEHDKTTTTSLQEEADPEVLRAKQAATAQFSGTANLGQSRDLGTTGNNAMDQAVNNPANTAASEKKPSGGWFIWVFIALIIIGIALWLFNMGGA
ncbi:FHA domain-containing protein [Psychrobacter submarinus]|uniref:FHA domain-containing protein n=1 Tax=Psychrobacter submarinus TaxID=154108 RepID=UPI001917D872|nr:FHA domain-containing protein [Psychrobacter submarinus]